MDFFTMVDNLLSPDRPDQPSETGEPPPPAASKKLDAPDFGAHWKAYSGWLANINQRTEGQLADVRARMSAAGASPDMLMQQTENLESQRKNEISSLEGGPTYSFLKEGYAIAGGKQDNPYATEMPGDSSKMPDTLQGYYSQFFGDASSATPKTPAEEATARAKLAAGGVSVKGGGGSVGSTSGAGISSVFDKRETFWG